MTTVNVERSLGKMKLATIAAGAATAGWLAYAYVNRDRLYNDWAVLASAAMLFGAIAAYRWQAPHGRDDFRLIAIVAFANAFATTGLSVIQKIDPYTLPFEPTVEAFSLSVISTLLFVITFLAGVYLTLPPPGRHAIVPARGVTPTKVPLWLTVLAAVWSIAQVRYGSTSQSPLGRLGTLPMIVLNANLIGAMVVAANVFDARKQKLPILIVLTGQAGMVLFNSSLGSLIAPLQSMVLARIYLRQRLPWLLLMLGVCTVIILNPAKMVFRNTINARGSDERVAQNLGDAISLWTEAIQKSWSSQETSTEEERDNLHATANRLNYNWASAAVFRVVPDFKAFLRGASYGSIPYMLAPRILFPNKQDTGDIAKNRWTVELGIQTWESSRTTSVAIPMPAEAYWNFGWLGVIMVALLVGCATGGMLRLAPLEPVGRTGYVVVLATSLSQFLDLLSAFVSGFVIVAITAVLARRYARAPSPRASSHATPRSIAV